jgi:Flp pilus assembly pilin Flp
MCPGNARRDRAGDLGLDKGVQMGQGLSRLGENDEGQDIAEYAVMLAVILVIVLGTVRLIGTNANTVFSNVASSIQ